MMFGISTEQGLKNWHDLSQAFPKRFFLGGWGREGDLFKSCNTFIWHIVLFPLPVPLYHSCMPLWSYLAPPLSVQVFIQLMRALIERLVMLWGCDDNIHMQRDKGQSIIILSIWSRILQSITFVYTRSMQKFCTSCLMMKMRCIRHRMIFDVE